MKKLFGMILSAAFVCVMGVGITGCKDGKDKTATTPAVTDVKKGLAVSKDEAVEVEEGKTKEVKVKYTLGTEAKIKKIAAEVDNDKAKVTKVAPETLKETGETTVTITGVTAGTSVVTVTATGEGTSTPSVATKLTVTVKKKST